jgi:hypothetical protein
MNSLDVNIHELEGAVLRLPPLRQEGAWGMAIPRTTDVQPTEDVR